MDQQPATSLEPPQQQKNESNKFKTIIIALLVIIIVGVSATSVYFYNQYTTLQKKLANPTVLADEELNITIDKVNKLIELPQGEKPILATVSNKEGLKGQPFFDKALTGDKVLVYVQAKKAVLYRPSTNKVINVAPVNVNTTPTPSQEADPEVTTQPTP